MLLPGHLAAGYLTAKALLHFQGGALTASETNLLTVLGAVVGFVPDLDLLPYFVHSRSFELKTSASHRDYPTHFPQLWLLSGLAVAHFAHAPFLYAAGLIIWLASWSHFLGDSIGGRIAWLWPFTRKRFGIFFWCREAYVKRKDETVRQYYARLFTTVYAPHPVFLVELALIVSALLILSG